MGADGCVFHLSKQLRRCNSSILTPPSSHLFLSSQFSPCCCSSKGKRKGKEKKKERKKERKKKRKKEKPRKKKTKKEKNRERKKQRNRKGPPEKLRFSPSDPLIESSPCMRRAASFCRPLGIHKIAGPIPMDTVRWRTVPAYQTVACPLSDR